jgi:hypothetical protein
MRREDRVCGEELAALIKKLETRVPLDKAEYKIITEVIRKTFALQRIYDEGREPTEEELEELLTLPRPEKAHE